MKFLLTFVLAMLAVCGHSQTSPTVRVDSISALVNLPIPILSDKFSAIVSGGTATGNSFRAGEFAYCASCALSTNSYSVLKSLTGAGQWIRITGASWNQTPNITIPADDRSYAFELERGLGTNVLTMGATATNVIIQSFNSQPLFINPVGANNVVLNELGGNVGVGVTTPLGRLDIKQGTNTVAPIKIHSGTILSTPQAGAIEYDGTLFYITTDDLTRRTIAFGGGSGGVNFDTTQFNTNVSVKSGAPFTNTVLRGSTSGSITVGATGSFIGTGTANGINVTTPVTELHVGSTSSASPRGVMTGQYDTGTSGARFHMRKSRGGSDATPTIIVTGDTLGRLVASGYDGANYLEMGAMAIESVGTIALTRVPTQIRFSTGTDATPSVLTEAIRWTAAQNTLIGGTSETGLTGAGGLRVFSTTEATTSAGAEIVDGGLLVKKAIFGTQTTAATSSTTGSLVIGNGSAATSVGMGAGLLYVGAATASSSITTGSLVNGGGFGNTGKGYFGADVNVGGDAASGINVYLNATAATERSIRVQTAGVNRWFFGADTDAESGSNAGSSFFLQARTDAGGLIDSPIAILRASGGLMTLARPISITSTTDASSSTTGSWKTAGGAGVAKKLYVGTTLNVAGDVQFAKTITAGGTTGAQTINKTMGSVNFAGGATSLVVTDSLVTTSSVIMLTVAASDTTASRLSYTPGTGSFTINFGVAPTAETRVDFIVYN